MVARFVPVSPLFYISLFALLIEPSRIAGLTGFVPVCHGSAMVLSRMNWGAKLEQWEQDL